MLNLETRLDSRLWRSVESSCQSGNYSAAILDSIHFLGELIREKSGLEGDGVALVGQAFGGKNPKLKLSRLQTETDWNIQNGAEQLLRGLYQGIRNPRSHEKYTDSVEDAEAIMVFVSYLVRLIDRSKSPFDKAAYLERVFDPYFTENEQYADLMVAEIPSNKRWDILMAVYRGKEEGNGGKLAWFIRAILKVLSVDETDQLCDVISEELKTTNNDAAIRTVLQIMPNELWGRYSEIGRIRIEARLINSISDGKYDSKTDKLLSGGFGTWAMGIEKHFILKSELFRALMGKLESGDVCSQDYFFRYFSSRIFALEPIPPIWAVRYLIMGLKAGDSRYQTMLYPLESLPAAWANAEGLKVAFDAFVRTDSISQGITDEDVPF